jgi:iron(III) transport system permease protein
MRRPHVIVVAIAVLGLILVLGPIVASGVASLGGEGAADRWARIDGVLMDRVVNTCLLGAVTAIISTLLGLGLAWALHRREFPGRRLLGLIYVAPLLVPPHIHTVSWLRVFGRKGYLSNWLVEQGWDFDVRAGIFEIDGSAVFYPGAALMLVSSFWPLAALVISAGFRQISSRHEEAGLVAVGRGATFRGVTLPLLRPHLWTGAFFVFIFAVSCYGVVRLLDTPTIMYEIFWVASQVDSLTAYVVAVPMVAIIVAALFFATLGTGRRLWDARAPQGAPSAVLRPRSWRAGLLAWGIMILTSAWPLVSLLRVAGGSANYRAIWNNVQPQLQASLILATIAGFTVTFFATAVALFAESRGRRGAFRIELAALLSFAFPAVVVGVSLNQIWGSIAALAPQGLIDRYVYRGVGLPILAYLTLFLPFGVRCLRASFARLSPRAEEAAAVAGRGKVATLIGITLPRLAPGLAASFVLAFVLTLGELTAGIMINPARWQTAQVRVFNMIHFSRDEEVAALCVMIIAMALIPVAIYSLVFNRRVEVL